MKQLIKHKAILFFAVLFIVFVGFYASGYQRITQPTDKYFYGDESGWVSSAYYYTNLALSGEIAREKWECLQCGPWGGINLHLGQWIIGVALKINAINTHQPEFFNLYEFKLSIADNIKFGLVPHYNEIIAARLPSLIFGLLCGVLVFIIATLTINKEVALIATALLFTNKVFINLSTQVMTDTYYNFVLLCICLSSIFLVRSKKYTHLIIMAIGIMAGLATSIKVTGILLSSLYMGLLWLYLLFLQRITLKQGLKQLSLFLIAALFIIYSFNPYFWIDTQKVNSSQLVQETQQLISKIKDNSFSLGKAITNHESFNTAQFQQDYPQLANFSKPLDFPYLFLRWSKLMQVQPPVLPDTRDTLSDEDFTLFKEHRLWFITHDFLSVYSNFAFEGGFFLIGLYYFALKLTAAIKQRQLHNYSYPLLFFSTNYLFILTFMKLAWDRYYIPSIIASKLIIALGIYQLASHLWRYLLHKYNIYYTKPIN
jgi:4-amino-4-deoxy-L-arabinose transferase-like glycosyltransferase